MMTTAETLDYAEVEGWAHVPAEMAPERDATSVAVDSRDRVYVFNRGPHPMLVLDADGELVDSWGAGEFDRPHGIAIDAEDNLYLADDGGHFVQKRRPDGELLFTVGTRGQPAPAQSGEMFNRPTHVAIHPRDGRLFVTDGYGNSRVHVLDERGRHLFSWGSPGGDPGEFSVPHNITFVGEDRLAVCDRENFRIQLFTVEGEFIEQWHGHRPQSIVAGRGDDAQLYVGELGPHAIQRGVPGLGAQLLVLDRDGRRVARIREGDGERAISAHGIAVDSAGTVYAAETAAAPYVRAVAERNDAGVPLALRAWKRIEG
jgi:DNA-binding beta-propeller fold protein YncE